MFPVTALLVLLPAVARAEVGVVNRFLSCNAQANAGGAMTDLRDESLSRLYLTITHQLIGGETFHILTAGPPRGGRGRLQLHTLGYDPVAPKGTGQWLSSFNVRKVQ